MQLKLIRSYFTEVSTIGELFVNGNFLCYTLEDRVRDVKIPNVTAIPQGIYPVKITWSNKFAQLMPLVMNVPQFTGIRIHWGNTANDTSGCLLVGLERQEDRILRSREAYTLLYNRIASAGGNATLTIDNKLNKAKSGGLAILGIGILTGLALWEQEQGF